MEINTINSLAAFINRILISLFILSSLLRSQWSTDLSSPQNLGDGIQPQMAATSNGGVYIAWITDGDYHVYVQFMDELKLLIQYGIKLKEKIFLLNSYQISWLLG